MSRGSRVAGRGSRVAGRGSRVAGRGSRVAGRGSRVAGRLARLVLVAVLASACAESQLRPTSPESAQADSGDKSGNEDKDDTSGNEKEAPEVDVDAIVKRAEAAVEAKDYATAEKLAREAIGHDRDGYPYAYVVLGDVAAAKGDHAAALGHFRKALKLDATDGWATFRAAETLVALDREGEARDLLRGFVTAHPEADAELYVALGSAERNLGDTTKAEAAYRAAIAKNAKDTDAYYGLVLVAQDRKQPVEAVRALKALLAVDPNQREDLASDPKLKKARAFPAVRALLADGRSGAGGRRPEGVPKKPRPARGR